MLTLYLCRLQSTLFSHLFPHLVNTLQEEHSLLTSPLIVLSWSSIRQFLPPANEVCEGYVFTRVCHSVHGEEGVCLSARWNTTPLWSRHPPPEQTTPDPLLPSRSRHPPWSRPPWEQCTPGDTANKRAARILLECILV